MINQVSWQWNLFWQIKKYLIYPFSADILFNIVHGCYYRHIIDCLTNTICIKKADSYNLKTFIIIITNVINHYIHHFF